MTVNMSNNLIVSEKNITAKRIASILSNDSFETEKVNNVPVYSFKKDGTDYRVMGLKGHILKVDFPAQYDNWQKVEPSKLIDAEIVKTPIIKTLVKTIQKEGKSADEAVIACDFDREGELIGVDALNLIKQSKPDIKAKRARFSSLTKEEITQSFSSLEDIYFDLAQAGEARQDIDLIWGATLTRFLSLATTRLGKQFLSVGRVQTPTLALIAAKENKRNKFVKEPFWVIAAKFSKDGEEFIANHKTEKFFDKEEAAKVLAKLTGEGKVTKISKTQKTTQPPAPFNTTAFLSAAAGIGISPARAMNLAENLYMKGLTSYPRVDNTVYPATLDFRGILNDLAGNTDFTKAAQGLLAKKEIKPTRGKKQSTDHPPIYPTGARPSGLEGPAARIYELITRRFLATLSEASLSETTRADIDCGGESFYIRGRTILKEGFLNVYHYGRKKDEEIPALVEGDTVVLVESLFEEKETQPPARYSQAKLVQTMEELGLGTKATRHSIIQSLYDRSYIHSDPIVPTELGLAVCDALSKHANKVTTADMTAELEKEMDAVASGNEKKEKVVERSRQMLAEVMISLEKQKEELSKDIREGIRVDKILGACPNCGQPLRVIRAKKSKKRFVGCTGYPDCSTSFPLPQKGEVISLGEKCEHCNSPKIKVITKGYRPWVLCLDPNCPTKQEKKE
ncbi:MAG: DNA topoisomerase I [Actinobacteria bacterium]|nr:MAG: DNA topoisomerase I [Actinomycetota bacterium]